MWRYEEAALVIGIVNVWSGKKRPEWCCCKKRQISDFHEPCVLWMLNVDKQYRYSLIVRVISSVAKQKCIPGCWI